MLIRAIVCLAVVTGALSLLPQCAACSMAGCLNDGDEMRPAFTILVTHDDKPLAGVTFHVVSKGAERFSGTTDEKGMVLVQTLHTWTVLAERRSPRNRCDLYMFSHRRQSSKKAKTRLTYTWGDDAPATTRIAGSLVDSQPAKGGTPIWNLTHRIDVPVTGAGLKLRDPVTHALYSTTSDQDGHFSFEGLPNGTYVLHIGGGNAGDHTYDPTDSVVELSSIAKRSELLFKGGPSGCGAKGLTLDLFN